MKKSVRIRKALPGEQPGYYNKTAKFLKKAQMGMQVNSPSNDPQRLNAIYTNVYASLMADITPDVIYSSLISEYALDENTALMILRSALGKLAEEGKIDPESLEGGNSQQNQKQEEQPSEAQDRESQEQYDQRMSEDAEQDELAMSDEGYYDEEEAANNDNSHLDTEEDEQQQAFRFGGYRQDGGESDEDYSDYYDDSNQSSSPEKAVINQYNNPGQNKMEKPFSIEDLIKMTPGVQGTQAIPGIEDYLGDYRPISDSYGSMNYLPTAKYGLGKMPKYQPGGEPPKGGLIQMASEMASQLGRGPSTVRQNNPLMNMSGIRRMLPLATLTGQAIGKLPLIGKKFQPEFKTTFTQNRNHLWEVLNGASPNKDIFSQWGGRTNSDGSLQANRLLLYQEDLRKIIETIENGKQNPPLIEEADGTVSWDYSQPSSSKTFKLGDIQPMAAADGLVSGVYPMDSKVTGGVDDEGNKFFEISHKFGPNQTLPFGSTSNRAKEITVKNRFYYNQTVDPNTNQPAFQVFGPLGENLVAGNQTKYRIRRPLLASALMSEKETLLNDPNTPFPNLTVNFGRNPNGPFTSGVGRVDITSTPPATVDRLSTRGKIGRGLENLGFSTWVPQIFGLGNPLRTSPKNVEELVLPTLGFSSSASGPNLVNPALETGVANDISRATNYRYRIGRNALLGAGALGYLGYKTWDSFYNQCQCDNPTGNNYMPKDEYGNCPCRGDVGDKRTLDPTGQPIEQLAPEEQLTVPDSMKFLIEQGLYPTKENYYRLKGKNKRSQAVDYKKGGQIPKYQPGGTLGPVRLGLQGLNEAELFFDAYRMPSFYGTMSPYDIKTTARNIPNLPEWIRREQAAQQSVLHWPTRSEIQNMLDIQRRILDGEFGTSDVIPTASWRSRISGGRNTSIPPITSISEMQSLAQDLGLVDINGNPISSSTAGQQTPLVQASPLSKISSLSYDELRALTNDQLSQLSQNINYPFTVRGNAFTDKTGATIPGGRITLHKHSIDPTYSFNTPYFGFYANMPNPIQAGRTFKTILQHALDEEKPSIMEDGSLSLDSFNILTNVGLTDPDWMIHPPEGTVHMNNMAVHHPLRAITTQRRYTASEIDQARMLLDNMMFEKGLIDMFGDAARMTIKPYTNNPDPSGDMYIFEFPNYRVQRKHAKGGITEKQFVKAFSSKFQDGGPQNQSLGKGKRMDTLTNDVESRKDIFKSKLKDNSNIALTKEIYKNAQNNPQILNMLMQDGLKENLAEDTGMQTAARGGVPAWYTGYNTAISPREYRKLYRQMKRMIPRGLDISRANMASNFYDNRFMQPGYGTVVSIPEYMNMLAMSSLPMYKSAAAVYGGGRKPSQLQADEATIINNKKGIPLLPEMTPDFIDSPLVGGSGGQFIAGDENLLTYAQGGFVDMDAENPLVRFIYGGNETEYYEPYDLPMAQFGQNIMNKDLEQRVVGDKLSYDDWVEGERDDFATTHPGEDFDTWKAGQAGKDDYKKYEDFYGKSLYDYTNFDDPNVNPNSNNTNNNTQNGKNCPQGYVWNATYNACIPVAQVTYNPRVVRGQSGLFRNLAPWNPAFGYAGSWAKQMSLPYQLGSGNPYMGQITGPPAARYVTKKGIFGKPKKWIDIYDVDGSGEAINPLEIEQLVGQQGRGSGRMKAPKGTGRRDMLQQYAQNQYGFTDDEWQDETRGSRRDMMRSVRQDMRADRRQDRRDNRERMFPRMRAIDADRNPAGRGRQGLRNVLSRSLPFGAFLQPKEYGGDLNEYGPGGINDPSYPGGYNPFSLGQGFSMGVGQNTSAFAPHSADAQFQNELMGGNGPSKLPPQQQNPFAFVTGTGTGSYAETANTGHTLGAQGQEIIPQKVSPNNKRNLVGVENKRKDMFNVDPESFLNQTNAFARGALNLFDPEKKRQCGPGTTWNSSTQTCQPTNAMDIYATATEQDRGDWTDIGSKAGLYRYDQMGQDRSSRATFGQYGGYMQQGGFSDPYFEEDEEVYMTPEELEQFLAAGGQVEYL